jgi:PIN domain nuclease of toxin-antitoxin system
MKLPICSEADVNLFLDTHILLWAAAGSDKLPVQAEELNNDQTNRLYFSAASIWEVVIKNSFQREDFHVDPHLLRRGLIDNGYEELAITASHTLGVAHLPPIHKDPFDRLLVAQAEVEGFLLLTADALVAQYPGPIQHV